MSTIKQYLPLLLLFLIPVAGFSQFNPSFKVTGTIKDESGAPIPYAQVRVQGQMIGTLTDQDGAWELELKEAGVSLEFSHIGYKRRFAKIRKPGHQRLHIVMQEALILDPVVISDGLQRVLEDKTLHLYDYEFYEDQLFIILYDRKQHRSKLALVNQRDSIIDVDNGVEKPGKLVRDCLGNVFAIGKEYACQLYTVHDQIGMYVDSLDLYERYVKPCLANLDEYYFYRRFAFNNQILEYFAYNAETEQGVAFTKVQDKVRMHQLMDPLSIYASVIASEEHAMTISPEQWKEVGTIDHEFQFQQMVFFDPVDAPLRVIDGKLYIFDHLNGLLRSYQKDGTKIDEAPIDYHKLPHYQKGLFVDEVRGEVYAYFKQHGYATLKEIDLETGALKGNYEVPRQFPQKITVRDGVLYFMYKELNYDDTNRLYRLRLKD